MDIFNCSQHNFVKRFADQVAIGNDILVDEENEMNPTKVINIFNFEAQGKF